MLIRKFTVKFRDPERQASQVKTRLQSLLGTPNNGAGRFLQDKEYPVYALEERNGSWQFMLVSEIGEFVFVELDMLLLGTDFDAEETVVASVLNTEPVTEPKTETLTSTKKPTKRPAKNTGQSK